MDFRLDEACIVEHCPAVLNIDVFQSPVRQWRMFSLFYNRWLTITASHLTKLNNSAIK